MGVVAGMEDEKENVKAAVYSKLINIILKSYQSLTNSIEKIKLLFK